MKRMLAVFAALCLLAATACAWAGDSFGVNLRARELDDEETEQVSRMDVSKAQKRIATPGDAMAVLNRRLDAGVYRNLIDGAWVRVGHNTYKVESGQYAYPGGGRYVDPGSVNQMVAWLLDDDMDVGVIMGFPKDDPPASVCCIRLDKGIIVFNAPLTMGMRSVGSLALPIGDYESLEAYVETCRDRSSVRRLRTLYYLPGGMGIRWKDRGSYVESEKKGPVLLWTAEEEENREHDWLD